MKKVLLCVCIMLLLRAEGADPKAPTRPVDEIISDCIFELIVDPRTAELKPISVVGFENYIGQHVAIEKVGWGDRPEGYYEISYRVKAVDGVDGRVGVELLIKKCDGNINSCNVLNARITYYSPTGNIYYNSVVSEPWPVEKKVNLMKLTSGSGPTNEPAGSDKPKGTGR